MTQQQHEPARSVRTKGAAQFLGVSVATLWRWRRARADFPQGIHLSARTLVFSLDELAAWRDAQGKM